jgi:hypothetical protein
VSIGINGGSNRKTYRAQRSKTAWRSEKRVTRNKSLANASALWRHNASRHPACARRGASRALEPALSIARQRTKQNLASP